MACTNSAMIHKVVVRRWGHKGCASTGTDAHVDGTVKVRERHVIDRGAGRGTVHEECVEHLDTV